MAEWKPPPGVKEVSDWTPPPGVALAEEEPPTQPPGKPLAPSASTASPSTLAGGSGAAVSSAAGPTKYELPADAELEAPNLSAEVADAKGLKMAPVEPSQIRKDFDYYADKFSDLDLPGVAKVREEVATKRENLDDLKMKAEAQLKGFEKLKGQELGPEQAAFADSEIKNYNERVKAIQDLSTAVDRDERMAQRREYDIKSNKGSFLGATHNYIQQGIGSIAAMPTSVLIDVMAQGLPASMLPASEEDINTKTRDQLAKEWKRTILPMVREAPEQAFGTETTKEYEQKLEGTLLGGAWAGLARSAPAMVTPAMIGAFAQATDGVMKEMEAPEYDDIPEAEKWAVAGPIGVVSQVLERAGFRNLATNNAATKNILAQVLDKVPANASKEQVERILNAETQSAAKNYLIRAAGGFAAEAETGGMQEIADVSIKDIYNKVKGTEVLNNPDTWGEFATDVLKASVQEGIGGAILSQPHAVSAALKNNKVGATANDRQFQTLEAMMRDPNYEAAFKQFTESRVENGDITREQADEALTDWDISKKIVARIPGDLDTPKRREAFDLLAKKEKLSKMEPDLVRSKLDKIKEQLAELSNEPEPPKPTADGKTPEPRVATQEEVDGALAIPQQPEDGSTEPTVGTTDTGVAPVPAPTPTDTDPAPSMPGQEARSIDVPKIEEPSLFRETDAFSVRSYVDPNVSADSSWGPEEIYAATDPSLALGQGRNASGIIVEFNPSGLVVKKPRTRNVGAETVEAMGGPAERTIISRPSGLRKNVRSITIPNRNWRDADHMALRRFLDREWVAEKTDRATIYRPRGAPIGALEDQGTPPAEVRPAAEVVEEPTVSKAQFKREAKAYREDTIKRADNVADEDLGPIGRALRYFASGGKVDRASFLKETGEKGRGANKWMWAHTPTPEEKKRGVALPTIDGLAHDIWETSNHKIDVSDARAAIIEVLRGHEGRGQVVESLRDLLPPTDDEMIDAQRRDYEQRFGPTEDAARITGVSEDEIADHYEAAAIEWASMTDEQKQPIFDLRDAIGEEEQQDATSVQGEVGDSAPSRTDGEEEALATAAKRARAERDKFVADWNDRGQGLFAPEEGATQQSIDGGFDNSKENFDAKLEPLTERVRQTDKALADYVSKAADRAAAAKAQTRIDQAPAKSPLKSSGVYYHYSNGDFDKFVSQGEEGYVKAHTLTGHGIYFLAGKPQMKYGKNEYKVHLDIKNPFFVQGPRRVFAHPLSGEQVNIEKLSKEDIDGLRKAGYDAIVHSTQTVVFDGSQVDILEKNGIKQAAAQQTSIEDAPSTSLADRIDRFADELEQKLGGISTSSIIPPQLAVTALRAVAKAVRAGQSLATAIADGLKMIQQSEWYQNLTKPDQKRADQEFTTPLHEFEKQEARRAKPKLFSEDAMFDEMRDQFRLAARSAREAVGDLKSRQRQFAAQVAEVLKDLKGKVSPAQVSALVTRALKTNLDNPKAVAQYMNYAARVVADVNYAKDLVEAKVMRKRASKMSRRTTVPLNHRQALASIAAIDVTMIEDPKAYSDAVTDYLKTFAPESKGYQPGSSAAIIGMSERLQGQVDAAYRGMIADEHGVDETDGITPKQLYDALESDDIDAHSNSLSAAKAKALNDVLGRMAEYSKIGLREHDISDATPEQQKYVKDLLAVDIARLSPQQRKEYIRTVDNIVINDSFNGAARTAIMARNTQAMASALGTVANTPIPNVTLRKFRDTISSVSDVSTFLYGLSQTMAKIQERMGLGDFRRAKKKWSDEMKDVGKKMADFYTALHKKHKDIYRREALTAEGMVANAIQQVPGYDPIASFAIRKEIIEQDIAAKEEMRDHKKEAAIARVEFDELLKNAKTPEEAMAGLKARYPGNHKSIEFLKELFRPYKDALRQHTEDFWNEGGTWDDPNYLPVRYKNAPDQTIADPEDAPRSSDLAGSMYKPDRAAGTIARAPTLRLPKGRLLDYNVRHNAYRSMSRNLWDLNTSAPWEAIRQFLKMPEANKVFGSADNKSFVTQRMNRYMNRQFQNDPNDAMSNILNGMASGLRSWAAARALGGVLQLPKQLTDTVVNTTINLGGRFDRIVSMVPHIREAKGLLSKYPIGDRGNIEGGTRWEGRLMAHLDELEGAIEHGALSRIKAASKKIGHAWMFSLTAGDALGAKSSWMAYYEKARAEQGHKITSWKEESDLHDYDIERQEAGTFAETMTSRSQASSDASEMAPISQRGVSGWENMGKAIALPFSSFSMQALSRKAADLHNLGYAAKLLADGNKGGALARDPAASARSLTGTVLGGVAYAAISVWAVRAANEAAANAILQGIVGGADDDDEDKTMVRLATAVEVLYTMGLMDADVYRAISKAQRIALETTAQKKRREKDNRKAGQTEEQRQAVKKVREWKARVVTDLIVSGAQTTISNALIDNINRVEYYTLVANDDPSVMKAHRRGQPDEPVEFSYWQKNPSNTMLYRPGQGWDAGDVDLGMLDVVRQRGESLTNQAKLWYEYETKD